MGRYEKEDNKQAAYLSPNISIITLSVKPNILNSPIKRQRLADWIYIHDPTPKIVTQVVESKKMQKVKQKNAGVATLKSDI